MTDFVVVENLGEINRLISQWGPRASAAMSMGLRQAAQPVKRDADRLSISELSGMKRAKKKPPPWSVQKIGKSVNEVYIVPTQRGKRYFRTDGDRARSARFVELMLGKSYKPALERNRKVVTANVNSWLGRVTREL